MFQLNSIFMMPVWRQWTKIYGKLVYQFYDRQIITYTICMEVLWYQNYGYQDGLKTLNTHFKQCKQHNKSS